MKQSKRAFLLCAAFAVCAAFAGGAAAGRRASATGTFLTKLGGGTNLTATVPVSISSQWVTAIAAGGSTSITAARCTDVAAVLAKTYPVVLTRIPGAGTNVAYSVRYRRADTTAGTVQLAVFGRTGTDPFERLTNATGADYITIVIDPTNDAIDVNDSTFAVTRVTTSSIVDCRGCDEIVCDLEGGAAIAGAGNGVAVVRSKIF